MRVPVCARKTGIERLPAYYMRGSVRFRRGRSSAWLERLPVTQEVASSTLVGPALFSSRRMITVISYGSIHLILRHTDFVSKSRIYTKIVTAIKNKITIIYKAYRDARSTTLSLIFVVVIIGSLSCISQTGDGIGTPVLVSPEDGSTIDQNPPLFVWNSIYGVVGYNIQVSDDIFGTLGAMVIDISCHPDTTYLPNSALASGSYYWRVQAVEGG
jgi:hypothetical protein